MKRSIVKRLAACLGVGLFVLAIGSCFISGPSYIRIANISSTYTLSHVYITPHNSSTWGGDLLSPGVITPGNSESFQTDPGYYDVWVIDTTPYNAYAYDIQVHAGGEKTLYFDGVTLSP